MQLNLCFDTPSPAALKEVKGCRVTPQRRRLPAIVPSQWTTSAHDSEFARKRTAALILTNLPHREPKNGRFWVRQARGYTITLVPEHISTDGQLSGYPFGILPRLITLYLIHKARESTSPRIELESSLADFLRELGITNHTGGDNGSITYAKRQAQRLFESRITVSYPRSEGEGHETVKADVAASYELSGAGSYVELFPIFHREAKSCEIPVPPSTLHSLKNSCLSLDLYIFLCQALQTVNQEGRPQIVSWKQLANRVGSSYTGPDAERNLGRAARKSLKHVKNVWPKLNARPIQGGFTLMPSDLPDR